MKLVDFATRRPVTVGMITVAVLLFGSVSLSRLKLNLLPDVAYPTLTVRTDNPGAAPAEIETLITKPVEEAVGIVKNVRRVNSVSRTGQSDVTLTFSWGTNMDSAVLDVREKLDSLNLPEEIKRPLVLRFDPATEPILRLGLAFSQQSNEDIDEAYLKRLRNTAELQLQKTLEAVEGVAAIKISGGLEDEIQVLVDQRKLAQLNLPIEQVVNRLRVENVNLSGGRVDEGTLRYLVRTLNQFTSIQDIGDTILVAGDSGPVYLRDVAQIRAGHREREAIIRINGDEAVEMAVYKEGDANTVAVARLVDARVEKIRENLPSSFELVKLYDQSDFINHAISNVVQSAVIGGLLAVLVIYLFLQNAWATAVISLAIPVSVIATFNMMHAAELTLNIMSLGGIALAIGLLVDNAIVVLENIARHRERGASTLEAVRLGAGEVGGAVTASTLTTVAVFFPMVFVQGVAGQLFSDQALVVTFALIISLLVSLTVVPMLAARGAAAVRAPAEDPPAELSPPRNAARRMLQRGARALFFAVPVLLLRGVIHLGRRLAKLSRALFSPLVWTFQRGYAMLERSYVPLLKWSLTHRAVVLVTALTFLGGALSLFPRIGMELIPPLAQGTLTAELTLLPGTSLATTDRIIRDTHQTADNIPNVALLYSVTGTGNRLNADPEAGGENVGTLTLQLQPGTGAAAEHAAMQFIRDKLDRVPGVEYLFTRPTLFSLDTPLEVEIAGYDLPQLRHISERVQTLISASERFADVKSTMTHGFPEVQIIFDQERAARLGLTVNDIAKRVVNNVRGEVATRYRLPDREIDVLVRAQHADRASIDAIRRLVVNPASERPVTLESVATVSHVTGPSEIRRVDQQRVAVISADVAFGDLGSAVAEINDLITGIALPEDVSINVTGQKEEMEHSFASLQLALILAVILVYLVMASQFESLLHPFVIIFTIPLALIGVLLALYVSGTVINVVVFIGLIVLAGIVVNNGIVLIDLINRLRAAGQTRHHAIVEAARSRLRPIIMTTLTTTLGLLPLAMGLNEGAEIRAPLAITIIGGLLSATLLTLVVIPVMYTLLDLRRLPQDSSANTVQTQP